MENCIKSIRQIDSSHKGLGIYLVLNQLCLNAQKSVFNIAPSGSGKKILINSVKSPNGTNADLKWDTITATALVNRLQNLAPFSKMIWRIEEFGTLTDNHRKALLSIGSKIITDHSYYRDMGTPSKPIILDIQKCDLTITLGIQPTALTDMINREPFWQSLGNDRFLKLIVINPLREKEDENMPKFDPISLRCDNFDIPEKPPELSKVFKNQVSDGRLNKWCRDLLRSFLTYEGFSEYSIKNENMFIELFGEIISLFRRLSFTESLDQPLKVSGGSIMLMNEIAKHNNNGGISEKELADNFRVYRTHIDKKVEDDHRFDTIRYHAKVLLSNDLVRKSEQDKYYLSSGLTTFFNWYEGLIS